VLLVNQTTLIEIDVQVLPIAPVAPGAGDAPRPADNIAGERGDGTRSEANPGMFRCDDDDVNEVLSTKLIPLAVGIGDMVRMLGLEARTGL